MPRTIPHAVLERIGTFLSKEEYLQLILVNHLFYYIYIKFLLNHVRIDTWDQLEQFMDQVNNHRYVHHLEVHLNELHGSDLKKMRQSLPHLKSIRFDLTCSDQASFELFHSLRYLYSITLDALPKSIYTITDLSFPCQLRRLAVNIGSALKVSRELLEHILTECPSLESMSIKGNNGIAPEDEQQNLSVSAHGIIKLELSACHGLGDTCSWLTYIANRYPKITSLKLVHASDPFDHVQWTHADKEEMSTTFYNWFLSRCSLLHHLETENIMLDKAFFQRLRKQRDISVETTMSNIGMTSAFLDACQLDWTDFSAMTKLDICFFKSSVKQGTIQTISKACPHLTQLVLKRKEVCRTGTLWINTLLDCFPDLKSLRLEKINLSISQNVWIKDNVSWHPLEEFHLEDCTLSNGFFHSISTRCPELKHLILREARFEYHHYKGHLDLPQQSLQTVTIERPHVLNLDQVIRLFHIKSETRSAWYYMRKYRRQHQTSLVVADRFVQLDETNTALLDTLLSQHPSSWKDVITNAYMHTSNLLEGIHIPKALASGYFEITCQSIGTLCLNDKRVF
ncbi:hypothetical protein BD560DRAFT_381867 [Blakeslea trispora]|nr:hypothetical protein BD560DRAFT_381867 [Blakeslea trispora]